MTILLSSLAIGNAVYKDLAYLCIQSFKEYEYPYKFIWEFLVENQESKEEWLDLLKPLEEPWLKFRVEVLKDNTTNLNIDKYVDKSFSNPTATKCFINRIKYLQDTAKKKEFDYMITLDLDLLFIKNISPLIKDFINSNAIYGGKQEPLAVVYDQQRLVYINLGIGFINLKRFPLNIWEEFLNKSQGAEEYFYVHDQSALCHFIEDKDKWIHNDLQLVVHALWHPAFRAKREYYVIHFTPGYVFLNKIKDMKYCTNMHNTVVLKYFHLYYKHYLKHKDHISKQTQEILEHNNKVISLFNRMSHIQDMYDKYFI